MRLLPDLPLYRLTVPTPFPVGPVNLYLITEPEPLLIDTGPAMDGALELLEKLLAESGADVRRLRKILLTHFHQDHCGLAAELAQRSGAVVYAGARERDHLAGDPTLNDFYHQMLKEAGTPPEMIRLVGEHFETIRSMSQPVEEFRPLEELAEIRCGAAAFRPLATPGHTPGHMALWEPERRILIAADTVIKNITPNPFLDRDRSSPNLRFPSLSAYLETLDRIRALDPAVVYSGHGEPVENFPAHHEELLTHHRKREEAVRACLSLGARTVYEVARCLFPDVVGRYNPFLAVSEVYAHLDHMEENGQIRHEMRDGVAIYSLKT